MCLLKHWVITVNVSNTKAQTVGVIRLELVVETELFLVCVGRETSTRLIHQ
jgi:hypothetical protein